MARAWCPFLKLVFLFRVSQNEKGLLLLGAVSPKLPTVFPATDESFIRGARFRQSGTIIVGDVTMSRLGGNIGIHLL